MTISSTVRKAGPFVGNGSAATFSFAFKVFSASDLLVVRLTVSSGVETTLQLTTDYTVSLNSDQDSNPGGSITLVAGALASGFKLVITSDIANLQPTDLTNQGGFYPEVITTALDRATIQIQQLQEDVDRSAKLPITSAEDADALVADIVLLADNSANINTVATNIANVNTVAGNNSNITTVAGISGNVTAVAGNSSNINAVAGNSANVNTVATNIASVNTTATNIVSVNAFSNVYYGSSATDPTTRQNSSPLQNGDLYFNTVASAMRVYNGVAWNDVAVGVSTPYATFSGTGSQTAFTLASAPGSLGSVEVYISGVRQVPGTNYTISGTTLTFAAAPPSGTNNIFVRWISTQAINVPADASVTTGKIVDSAVTTAKLADASVTFAKLANSGHELGIRNRIINGGMRIDQRNAGASVTLNVGGTYIVDRFYCQASQNSKVSAQRSTVAPSRFTNSLQNTVLSAVTPAAADYFTTARQNIEGLNVSDLGWGTANAVPIAVSFWVRSSVTGTYSFSVSNFDGTRGYVKTFTINAANTWEYKSFSIVGDVSGTWLADTGIGFSICIDLGSGSNFNAAADTWGASGLRTSGSVNWISNAGATFYITGVQLEAGSVATPFEHRLFGTELQLCQRYYETSYSLGTAVGSSWLINEGMGVGTAHPTANYRDYIYFKVSKCTSPNIKIYDAAGTIDCFSYYTTAWNNGGTVLTISPVAKTNGFYIGHNVASSTETQFAYTASAEL